MTKRVGLSKKIRFEVFKRDSFTCQYCGAKAPDVLLVVDHIQPVSKEGTNDILNLITCCGQCNAGKGNRELDDNTVLQKQRDQLAELQERREQLEMMVEWKTSLSDINNHAALLVADFFTRQSCGLVVPEQEIRVLRKWIREFGQSDVMDAMVDSINGYAVYNNGVVCPESFEKTWNYIPKIIRVKRAKKTQPYLEQYLQARAMVRWRTRHCGSYNDQETLAIIKDAHEGGVGIEDIFSCSRKSHNYYFWKLDMQELVTSAKNGSRLGVSK